MRYWGFLLAELFDSLPNSIPLGSTNIAHVNNFMCKQESTESFWLSVLFVFRGCFNERHIQFK